MPFSIVPWNIALRVHSTFVINSPFVLHNGHSIVGELGARMRAGGKAPCAIDSSSTHCTIYDALHNVQPNAGHSWIQSQK